MHMSVRTCVNVYSKNTIAKPSSYKIEPDNGHLSLDRDLYKRINLAEMFVQFMFHLLFNYGAI